MNTVLKVVKDLSGKRDYINRLTQSEPRTGVLFKDFVKETALRKSKRMGESYVKNYNTLIFHLNEFADQFDANIYTNSIGEEFMDDFVLYLEGKYLKQNYIVNLLFLVKSMASKAAKYGYAVDPGYDDVEIKLEPSFSIFLSMNDITRVYYFKGLSKKQERIKDLFVVGCLTALRFSDYSTLIENDFTKDYIVKVTKKTKAKVTIPLHDYVREILIKYNGVLYFGLSIQYFNRAIKSICKQIGFIDEIRYNLTKGGKLVYETKQKWELISSHTARRSAATNMYQTGRMTTASIMQITGHTTEKSFFRYIKTSDEDKAKQIAGDSFFRR
jgi:integrase